MLVAYDRDGNRIYANSTERYKECFCPECGKPLVHKIHNAKYKPIGNIGNQDYLQVLAYMFRFDAKKAFYFYPESTDLSDKELWLNKGSSFEDNVSARDDICLIKHGLRIPQDAVSYSEFETQIKDSELEFAEVFK